MSLACRLSSRIMLPTLSRFDVTHPGAIGLVAYRDPGANSVAKFRDCRAAMGVLPDSYIPRTIPRPRGRAEVGPSAGGCAAITVRHQAQEAKPMQLHEARP